MEKISDEEQYNKFIEDLKLQDKTQKTVENYGSCLKDFMQWLHKKGNVFTDVQGQEGIKILKEYLKYLREKKVNGTGKTLTYARIKIYFSALNCFYDMLLFDGLIDNNNVLAVRKRYLNAYKNGYRPAVRQVITVEEMSRFLKGIFNLQDKVITIVFVKTGVRKGELMAMDVDDVDLEERTITIKERFKKRTNCEVVFDQECKHVLQLWLQRREQIAKPGEPALFLNEYGHRIHKNKAYSAVTYWATRAGIHDASSSQLKNRFSPHNLRHCWVNYLTEAKMHEPFIEWLRGDSPGKSIDHYKHITIEKVRDAYDNAMPRFGL